MHPKKGLKLLKEETRSRIVLTFRTQGPLSRAQVAKITGLSRTCVFDTCNELLAEGMLVETGTILGSRGRPIVLLGINSDGPPVAGVRIALDCIEIAVARPSLEIMSRRIIPYEWESSSVEAMMDVIANGISGCASAAGSSMRELSGVGLTVHSMVDPLLGMVEGTHLPYWNHIPIGRELEERVGLPVVTDNCVRAGAIVHQWFAPERPNGRVLYVCISDGVGGALVYDREVVQGIRHSGNQLGHMMIDPNGPVCECGNRGCLEALASDHGFIRQIWPEMAVDQRTPPATREMLIKRGLDLMRNGDPKATKAYHDTIKYLAMGLSNATTVLGPETIVITGTIIDMAPNTAINDIRMKTLEYISKFDKGVEIRALLNNKEYLMRGAIGLILCQPYRDLRQRQSFPQQVEIGTADGVSTNRAR